MTKLLAQFQLGPIQGYGNRLGNVTNDNFSITFVDIMSQVLGILTVVGALWFMFRIFTTALAWISAGGDKQAVEGAKQKFTQAIIGLLVVVISYALLGVVGYFLGIDIINLNGMIRNLAPT